MGMYLTDEEYNIIKKALDDAEYMQRKYSGAIHQLEECIVFLSDTIIKHNMCEIADERKEMLKEMKILRETTAKAVAYACVLETKIHNE